MSISGALRQKRDVQFVDGASTKQRKKRDEEDDEVEGDNFITINRSELVNREDYEREKIRQLSRSDFQQQRLERLSRMMPNKQDRAKNNIRALAFDVSGTLEQDRIRAQKSQANARKKYGW